MERSAVVNEREPNPDQSYQQFLLLRLTQMEKNGELPSDKILQNLGEVTFILYKEQQSEKQ